MRATMPLCVAVILAAQVTLAGTNARTASAQPGVPTITIDRGAREITEPFSLIGGLFELRDGRVLVLDASERELLLVDFTRDTQSPAARTGAGPLEFMTPGAILPGGGDSAVYYDITQRRLLIFAPNGTPARSTGLGGMDPMSMISMPQPGAIDASGLVYGQTMGMRMPTGGLPGPNESMFADTVVVVRLDSRSGRSDTVTRLASAMARSQPRMEMTGGTMKMTLTGSDFAPADAWTALPDGRVAVLRGGDYRVRFLSRDGRETVGPPVAHTKIPLTAAMRRASMDSMRAALPGAREATNRAMSEAGARAGAGALPMPNIEFDVREPAQWASHLPPYTGVRASPDGQLWVSVPESVGDGPRHLDVLDGSGRLIARVRFAPGESMVGLGRGTVYTTRRDEDDLLYLRRYALPAPIASR